MTSDVYCKHVVPLEKTTNGGEGPGTQSTPGETSKRVERRKRSLWVERT